MCGAAMESGGREPPHDPGVGDRVRIDIQDMSYDKNSKATRSRNCNLRIRPTDPGVATLSDFESVGPDRPTRCAERGGGILGRNDCFLAVSGGFERFQAVLDRHSPTDRPRSEKG